MPKEDIGLILLGVGSAFGVWSAMNTSPVGTVEFGQTNPGIAQQGMTAGLVVILGLAAGIFSLYGKKGTIAAAATGITGVALYAWYAQLLASGAPTTP